MRKLKYFSIISYTVVTLMSEVVKVGKETFQDIEMVRELLVTYGTKNLSDEAQQVIAVMKKDKLLTYKGIVAASVKVLRVLLEKMITEG